MGLVVNCDQMMWIQNALTRYAQLHHSAIALHPRVAQHYAETNQVACIIELMDILDLTITDPAAEGNLLAGVKALLPLQKSTNISKAAV